MIYNINNKKGFNLKDNSVLQDSIERKRKENEANEFVSSISQFINGAQASEIEKVAELMTYNHPTLQQDFMRFFMSFVDFMSQNKKVDNRNIDSVLLSIEIMREIPDSDRNLRKL